MIEKVPDLTWKWYTIPGSLPSDKYHLTFLIRSLSITSNCLRLWGRDQVVFNSSKFRIFRRQNRKTEIPRVIIPPISRRVKNPVLLNESDPVEAEDDQISHHLTLNSVRSAEGLQGFHPRPSCTLRKLNIHLIDFWHSSAGCPQTIQSQMMGNLIVSCFDWIAVRFWHFQILTSSETCVASSCFSKFVRTATLVRCLIRKRGFRQRSYLFKERPVVGGSVTRAATHCVAGRAAQRRRHVVEAQHTPRVDLRCTHTIKTTVVELSK